MSHITSLEVNVTKSEQTTQTKLSDFVEATRKEVSIEMDAKVKNEDSSCFPPNSIVHLEDGTHVTMAELRPGQKVLSLFSNGKAQYSSVYFIAHQDDKRSAKYISIRTPEHTIKLTPDHHIFINDCGHLHTVPARDIKVRDTVMVASKDNTCIEEEMVIELSRSTDVGIYAPITMYGTIIVNSVLASCYVDVVPPQIAHPLLWPKRQLYQLAPSLSSAINVHGKDGMPIWVKWFMDNVLN